jgi:two-component system response regulator YesN
VLLWRIINRNSIFIKWLLSYLTVLFIPLVILSAVYLYHGKTIETEIGKANSSSLRQVKTQTDEKFKMS